MFKKFSEIKEAISKTTKVPGSTPAVANKHSDKVVGYNRGHQPGTNKGQYKMNHVPPNHNQVPTTAPTNPKKYAQIQQRRHGPTTPNLPNKPMYEDGMGAGGAGGASVSIGNSSIAPISGPQANATDAASMSARKKKIERRKSPVLESFNTFIKESNERTMASTFGARRGPRHVRNYIAPFLSKEGRKKTKEAFENTEAPLNFDHNQNGELYDPKAEHTHVLGKAHNGHPAGTRIKITHVSHEDGKIYAHTENHGRIPLSKIKKPESLRKKAVGAYGIGVESTVAKNLGQQKSAGFSKVGTDFSVHHEENGKHKISHGVVKTTGKEKTKEEQPVVRGESKLDRGRFGTSTLTWNKRSRRWRFTGDRRMHAKFAQTKVVGDDGVERSILDHLNHHHPDGVITRGFSARAPVGTSRHYLRRGNINVLHLHNIDNRNSTTYTVGNTSLHGKTNLGHLSDRAIDRLDGRIHFEPGARGKIRVLHSPNNAVMKEYAEASTNDPENHKTLENSEHAKEFLRRVREQ